MTKTILVTALIALGAAPLAAQTARPSTRPPARPSATSATPAAAAPTPNRIVVYKSPTCGCCGKWIDYMRANGFTVEVHDQDDLTALKRAAGISDANASCHTGQIGGYVVEGHVPVAAIRRMLRERPAIAGLSVPGMVAGTPGMEQGNAHPPYDVVAIGRDGRTSVYERH